MLGSVMDKRGFICMYKIISFILITYCYVLLWDSCLAFTQQYRYFLCYLSSYIWGDLQYDYKISWRVGPTTGKNTWRLWVYYKRSWLSPSYSRRIWAQHWCGLLFNVLHCKYRKNSWNKAYLFQQDLNSWKKKHDFCNLKCEKQF